MGLWSSYDTEQGEQVSIEDLMNRSKCWCLQLDFKLEKDRVQHTHHPQDTLYAEMANIKAQETAFDSHV